MTAEQALPPEQQQQQQPPKASRSWSLTNHHSNSGNPLDWRVPFTTTVAPTKRFGPFGAGGTVVGFSKFPGVRAAFCQNFAERLEAGAQLVVYEGGEKVVDLYGVSPGSTSEGYDGDTLQCVFSSGKNLEALAMAMLVDRGLVNYEDLVAQHWPEFGTNGKEGVTIADVMRHSGGVPFVVDPQNPRKTVPIVPADVFAVAPAEAKLCGAERYPPSDAPSTCCYHAQTRGWIVNGILRRVDPARRSLSRFLREEITGPLAGVHGDPKEVTVRCGIPEPDQSRYTFADITKGSMWYLFFFQLLPALFGLGPKHTRAFFGLFLRRDMRRLFADAFVTGKLVPEDYFDTPEGRAIEHPSAGMVANARSLALVNAAGLAGDGSLGGVRLLSEQSLARSMGGVVTGTEVGLGLRVGFTRGGYGVFCQSFPNGSAIDRSNRIFHPDDSRAYGSLVGWGGIGGSLSLVDRDRNLAVAYCGNGFACDTLWGIRTRRILLALQDALAQNENKNNNDDDDDDDEP